MGESCGWSGDNTIVCIEHLKMLLFVVCEMRLTANFVCVPFTRIIRNWVIFFLGNFLCRVDITGVQTAKSYVVVSILIVGMV